MKRIILLVLTIILAMFFSSCDSILEGFFPKITDKYDMGPDGGAPSTIEVGVWIDNMITNQPEYYNNPVEIRLEMWDQGMMQWMHFDQRRIFGRYDIYERFDGVPPGEYRVLAYWDQDSNYNLDTGMESNILLTDMNWNTQVITPQEGGAWIYMEGWLDLGDNDYIP